MACCRLCPEFVHKGDGVKYGIRHYAHFECYIKSGKELADLEPWQVGQFPWKLIRDHGLDHIAMKLIERRG